MKNFKKQLIYFTPLLLLSCKCGEERQVEGGPCTYETKVYPATVIHIENIDSTHADILFRVDDETGKLYRDSVSFKSENRNWPSKEELQNERITVGKKYRYEVNTIKTGSCNPSIDRLTLIPFEK